MGNQTCIARFWQRCGEWTRRLLHLMTTTPQTSPEPTACSTESCCASVSLLKNEAYLKLAEQCCEMHEELDRMSNQFSDTDMLNLINMQKSRIREALILSGATAIDEESTFNLLRHKPQSPGIVRDGAPILETVEPGVAIENRVMIKAKVLPKIEQDIQDNLSNNFEQLKSYLIKQIPSMGNILSVGDWDKLKKSYSKRYSNITVSNCLSSLYFIDYVIGKESANDAYSTHCKGFISALNHEIEIAMRHCGQKPKLEKDITEMIRQMFITGDVDPTTGNSDFKNRLNELVVFNYLSNCDNIEVCSIEEPLENGKSVDFLVYHKIEKKNIGYEIVTMQNVDPTLQEDSVSMTQFLDDRIRRKYDDKINGLRSTGNIDKIYIMPIVEYKKGLEKFNMTSSLGYSTPIMTSDLFCNDNSFSIELRCLNDFLNKVRCGEINIK